MHPLAAEFRPFDTAHNTALLLTVAVPAVLIASARVTGSNRFTRWIAVGVGAILLVNEIAYRWYHHQAGTLDIRYALPMQLCDWTIVACILALFTRKQVFYEMSYFWGFSATAQALLTPDIWFGWPDPRFMCFFIAHSGIVVAALYLTLAMKMRPKHGWFLRMFIAGQAYLAGAAVVNQCLDSNYGFLCSKPDNASLFDYFGPWPYYILTLEIIATVSYWFYFLPFLLKDRFWPPRPCGHADAP